MEKGAVRLPEILVLGCTSLAPRVCARARRGARCPEETSVLLTYPAGEPSRHTAPFALAALCRSVRLSEPLLGLTGGQCGEHGRMP